MSDLDFSGLKPVESPALDFSGLKPVTDGGGGLDYSGLHPAHDEQPAKQDVPDFVRPAVGFNRTVADIAGAPVDAVNWALNKATGSNIKEPFGGAENIDRLMGTIGANPNDVAPAKTPVARALEGAGSGMASMLVPGMGAEAALAHTWAEGESFGNAALDILKGNGAVSNAVIGAASGAGQKAASDAAPDSYKDLAGMAGGMGAGVGVAGAMGGISAAASIARNAFRAATDPAEARAAQTLLSNATDPDAFRQNLADAVEAPDLVEGSKPTTFQATGDLGVGALERSVAASPDGVAPFAARREQQNAARLDELDKLADPTADPAAVSDYVRSRLQDITDDHAAMVSDAAHGVADSLAKAGGDSFDNPAAYGEALRTPLAALHQQAKDAASSLWRAIDPDMSAPVNVAPLKQATSDLVGQIPDIAKQPAAEEASILQGIGNMPDTASFGDMVALRGRLTDAMRDERRNGTPTVLRRLAITLSNVDDTLANTAGEIAADPVQKQDIVDRFESELKQSRQAWYNQNNVAVPKAVTQSARENIGVSGGGYAAPGSSGVSAAFGSGGEAGGQSGISSGDQGVQATAGIAPEVAARYDAARGATKDLKTTFESGPVGGVLAPGGQFGSFKTTASNVPHNLFDKPEALQAYVNAAGNNPTALAPMQDYAAFSLRQAAVRDGMFSPAKYQQWVDSHAYALRQFPDLIPKFADVASAQSTLDTALGNQKQALTDYQTGAVKSLLNGQDPVQAAGKALADPGRFASLAAEVHDDPAATAGLKRATVDYMMGKALGTAESGTSGLPQINAATLQKFYFQNRTALSNLFSPEELSSMERVTVDLQRANRSIVAVKIPGGSNTAQDTGMRAMSVLQNVVKQYGAKAAGLALGTATGGPVGAGIGFLAGAAGDAARAARADNINKAVVEMMLDPKMANAWLSKVTPESSQSAMAGFARQLRAVTANQVAQATDEQGQTQH